MGSIRKKKGNYYYRYYDIDGNQREISLKTNNLTIAERMRDRYDDILYSNSKISDIACLSLGEVFELFMQHIEIEKSQNTVKDYYSISNRFDSLKPRLIKSITENDLKDLFKELENRKLSVSSRSKAKIVLNQLFEWGMKRGFCSSNYVKYVKLPSKPKKSRVRFFSDEEIRKIFDYSDTHQTFSKYSPYYKLLLLTGMRLSELVSTKWSDIDFELSKWFIHESKTHSGRRVIPIVPGADTILHNLNRDSEYIVNIDGVSYEYAKHALGKSFKKILKAVGINEHGVNLHVLRHTFASKLVMNGASLEAVRDLLGHSSVTVTEIYAHLSPDYLTNAISKLNVKF